MPHKDATVLIDMLQAAQRAIESLEDLELKDLQDDWKVQSIVLHQLLILGEAAKRLSAEFRELYSHIPWRQMAGMRDLLIHCYDTVDLETVWTIVKRELPPFVKFLEPLIPKD